MAAKSEKSSSEAASVEAATVPAGLSRVDITDLLSECPKIGSVWQRLYYDRLQRVMISSTDEENGRWRAIGLATTGQVLIGPPDRGAVMTRDKWVPADWSLNEQRHWVPPAK